MADYASQLLGPSARQAAGRRCQQRSTTGSLLRRGQYSESVMGARSFRWRIGRVAEVSSLAARTSSTALKYTARAHVQGR